MMDSLSLVLMLSIMLMASWAESNLSGMVTVGTEYKRIMYWGLCKFSTDQSLA